VALEIISPAPDLRLRLTAADAWLDDPARTWPVTVDPTLRLEQEQSNPTGEDTFIEPARPTTNFALHPELQADSTGGASPARIRSVVDFHVENVITEPVVVRSADLELDVLGVDAGTPRVAVHGIGPNWNLFDTTWNQREAGVNWAAAGGDYDPAASDTVTIAAGDTSTRLAVTSLVQGWLDGTRPNQGMLLKIHDESQDQRVRLASDENSDTARLPQLVVNYDPIVGRRDLWTYEDRSLGEFRSLAVNVANGNLNLAERDLTTRGTGIDAVVERFYNSRADLYTDIGHEWQMWPQTESRLYPQRNGDVVLYRDSVLRFARQPDGSYREPSGTNAVLTATSGGFTLRFNQSGEQWLFTASGYLASIRDRNGNTVGVHYDADGRMASMTDTQGRVTTFERTAGVPGYGKTVVAAVVDPAGRRHSYTYGVGGGSVDGNLTSYTNPDGKTTTYTYEPTGNNLAAISDNRGNVTRFDWDSSDRLAKITRVTDPAAGTGPATTFTYNAGNTVVTDANAKTTTYHYDRQGRVTATVDARGNQRSTGYNSNSNVTTATDAGTNTTTYGYSTDGRNNPISAQLPTGARTTMEYASASNVYAPLRCPGLRRDRATWTIL